MNRSGSIPSDSTLQPARISLFGHPPTRAMAVLLHRSGRSRLLRALAALAMGAVVVPLVALVPPHAPWAIGAFVLTLLAVRAAFRERWTLVGVEGCCPRCGEAIEVGGRSRLRDPHPLSCRTCRHEPTLTLEG